MITLLILLQLKHFICDFPLQKPYQYLNKGIYGHGGGILHASIHGVGTLIALLLAFAILKIGTEVTWHPQVIGLALKVAILDALIHYHIDWAKVKINKRYGWKCDNSEKFWYLLGFDQLLHQLTYIGIVAWLN